MANESDLGYFDGGGLLGGRGGGWLGNLLKFNGGRSTTADLYGDLFTKKQLEAIQQRESDAKFAGLLGAINQFAAPSEFKKGWGQLLGTAGQAMLGAEGGDKAATTALGGQKTAAQIAQLRAEMEANAVYSKAVREAYARLRGAPGTGGAPPGAPAAPPAGAPTAPPPSPTPGAPTPNPAGAPVNLFAPPPISYAGPGSTPARRPFGMSLAGAPGAGGTPVNGPGGVRDDNPDSPTYGQYVLPPTPPSGPDPGDGVGMPPVDPRSQYAMMMGGGLLGAGGGGAQPPPTEGDDSLPPQDTVIPSGQAGLLSPDMLTPAAFSGGSGERPIDIIARRESGNRNIMQQVVGPNGGYNPSVGRVTGPSSAGGPHQIIDPTWRAAAKKIGVDTNLYPKAILAPRKIQDDVAQHLYDTEGYAPWAPYNKALAREVGWKGAQYTEGSGGGSGPSGGATPAPSAGGGGLGEAIPGLGISALDMAELDALAAAAGKQSPFKSLMDAYYKTPGYLGTAAAAESRARKDVDLQMDPLIREQTELAALRAQLKLKPELEAAIEEAKNPALEQREAAKAKIDRITKRMEQTGAAALEMTTLKVPDGEGGLMEVPATRAQAVRAAHGLAVPELGIPARRTDDPTAPTGAPIAPPIGTPILTEPEKKISGAVTEEFIEMRKTARLAAPTIRSTHDLRAKLDSGMFTGLDADWSLFGAKLGDALGLAGKTTQEKIANTEVYISKIGEETANLIKSLKLGPPTSDADVKFAERIAGRQNLSAAAIRELLEMREKYARLAIQQYNDEAQTYSPRAFGGGRQLIPMPEPYVQKQGTSPSGNKWSTP